MLCGDRISFYRVHTESEDDPMLLSCQPGEEIE